MNNKQNIQKSYSAKKTEENKIKFMNTSQTSYSSNKTVQSSSFASTSSEYKSSKISQEFRSNSLPNTSRPIQSASQSGRVSFSNSPFQLTSTTPKTSPSKTNTQPVNKTWSTSSFNNKTRTDNFTKPYQPGPSVFNKLLAPPIPKTDKRTIWDPKSSLDKTPSTGYVSPYSQNAVFSSSPASTSLNTTTASNNVQTLELKKDRKSFFGSNSKAKKGSVFIFNQETFARDEKKKRLGTEKDVSAMKDLFKKFNFNVNVEHNSSLSAIEQEVVKCKF